MMKPTSEPAFKDHFSARAADYARYRPLYPDAMIDWLVSLTRDPKLAWDAGAGSGQFSSRLARRVKKVVASDASFEQLKRAPRTPGVSYMTARAEESGLKSHSVDMVTVAQAAHWFDLDLFFAEARRVAKPGAVVALVTYGTFKVNAQIDPILDKFYFRTLAGKWPKERRHVEDGYASLPFPFAEVPHPTFDLTAEWTADDIIGYVGTWSAVRVLEKAGEGKAFQTFANDLRAKWGNPERSKRVRWPVSMRVGRVV